MVVPIQPLADYVVAQQEKAEQKTVSGLYLPDAAKEKPQIAKILAVGKEVKNLKKGDKIIYKNYSTTDIKMGTDEYILIKEEDVLATVN